MLARSQERTNGPEEEGVRMFKDELKESVLKKDSNRLGDYMDNVFYLVSTLCDPRYIFPEIFLVTSTDSTLNQVQGLFLPGRSDSPASKTLAGATH